MESQKGAVKPVIVVHGGAWAVPDEITEDTLHGVKEAAKLVYRQLLSGCSCVDAVVNAVSILEDNPLYDAGRGSVLTSDRTIEMQAIVMRGDTVDCGGVIGIKHVKNPVKAARLVLEKTEHCVLDGDASLALAREQNLEEMPDDYFVTPAAKEELETFLRFRKTVESQFSARKGHDTVGAVALDSKGNLACATSTGGITGQMPGRVSDSPLPGSGGYADNNSVAVSSTGHGESIMKTSLARTVSLHVENGNTPQKSVEKALEYMETRVGGHGGAIAVDAQGRVGIGFTTVKMSWAVAGSLPDFDDGKTDESDACPKVTFGIHPGDRRTEPLSV